MRPCPLRRSWSGSTRSARCGGLTPRPSRGWIWPISTTYWSSWTRWSTRRSALTERIDELRGRIEILMDEIEISLGIEPPVIASEDAGESDEEES